MLGISEKTVRAGRSDEVAEAGCMTFVVEGREIAVFRRDGNLFAIDDHCPHNKASLGAGSCSATTVACPWHGWQFDLRTGESVDHPGFRVVTHAVEERDGELWLTLADEPELHGRLQSNSGGDSSGSTSLADDSRAMAEWAGAFRGLVRYGAMAWVGHFRSNERFEGRHGVRVLVQTSRGLEVGELLSTLTSEPPRNDEGRVLSPAGELVRPLNPMETFEHARRQRDERILSLVQEVLAESQRRITERDFPVDVLDAELLFDKQTLVLYFLGSPTADLGRLAAELGDGREFKVVFNSVLEAPATSSGGSCGCGSGGGGCGAT